MQLMTRNGTNPQASYNTGFSPLEVRLLGEWELARKRWVTIDDIRKEVGNVPAAKVASALARKGALVRLKRGLYLIRPFRLIQSRAATSASVSLEVMLHGEPHYGGLWAFSQNSLTEQLYWSNLDVFVARPHRAAHVPGANVSFHVVPRDSLEFGVVNEVIEGMHVPMSDPERTLADLLERPRIAGGLRPAMRLFTLGLPRVIQREAVKRGLDKMSDEDIDNEIAAARRSRRRK